MADVDEYQKLVAPDEYLCVRKLALKTAYVPSRKAAVVGIDGYPSSGKTPLAAWLSWQLECPVINLDEFRTGRPGYELRDGEVLRLITQQLECDRPVIVEGLFLLESMQKIGVTLNCHIWAQIDGCDPYSDFNNSVWEYTKRRRDEGEKPDYICRTFSEEFDEKPYPEGSRAWTREEPFDTPPSNSEE